MESNLSRKNWSEEEIKILKEKYPEMGSKCSLFIGRNEISVKSKAKKLKLKYDNRDAWTDDEVSKLKDAWSHYDMDKLLITFPGRTYSKIMGKARQLSLKSETNRARRGCLDYLDTLTPKSVYWWGFIMADGHINRNDFVLSIHKDDISHLEKLSILLKTKIHHTKTNMVSIRTGNRKFCEKWLNILNIKDIPKTYSGINYDIFEPYFTEFIIGFIDGDGHIRYNNKHKSCTIELHSSWYGVMIYFSEYLEKKYSIKSNVVYTKGGKYVRFYTQNKDNLKKLKSLVSGLPYLGRKWDKIIL
jgi:hypothetical protein